jgi:hypothetical protein
MKYQALFSRATVARAFATVALAAGCASSWALPVFTLTPAAVGLTGSPVTADNIILSDFSRVNFTGGGNFNETGFLSITSFQLGGTNLVTPGLNSTYSLYFQFTGTGHLTLGSDPSTGPTFGQFDALTYTLYGATGNSTFSLPGDVPTVSSTAPQVLATGSLLNGIVFSGVLSPSFVPGASATMTFGVAPGKESFFSPQPFYNVAVTSFVNPISTVHPITGGFTINNGGGSLNFATPIPEPETYALMLAGLGAVAFMARRRRS